MKNSIVTLLSIAIGCMAAAQNPSTPEQFSRELAAKSPAVETIVCRFTETRHMSIFTEDVVREGRFSYKRPARMLLDFASGDRILMTEEQFILRSGGRTTAARMHANPMLRHMQAVFAACMTGDADLLKGSGAMEVTATPHGYRVRLVPASRSARKYVSVIVLDFDRSDMTLTELRMEQPSHDYIRYRFREKQLNTPLADTIFQIE